MRITIEFKPHHGLWLAFAGVALQLTGLCWDALLHHYDPGLAERESVFSLTNPSHLMVMLGLGLIALGVVWGLTLGSMGGGKTTKQIAGPVLAGVAVIALLGATGSIGIATGGLSGQHSHHNEDGAAVAADGHAHTHTDSGTTMSGDTGTQAHNHSVQLANANDPVFLELQGLVNNGGTEQAIARLQVLAAKDASVNAQGHTLIHDIGRYSYEYYGDAQTALSHCREAFASGCYHGVLEAYFSTKSDLQQGDIANLCASAAPDQTTFLKFQCVHGMGHGLTMYFDHDIFQALQYCDYLPTSWDQESCYGGVFMENVFSAGQPNSYLKADDPHYPCNVVPDRYKGGCYIMQSSVMLMFNGYDYAATAKQCDGAPAAHIAICYQSLGRDISGATLRDADRAIESCSLGTAQYRSHCFAGVAKDFIDNSGKTDEAFVFCQKAPADAKSLCYQGIGEMVATLYTDRSARVAECARAEPAYVEACSRAIG